MTSLRRRYRDLQARYQQVIEERDDAIAELDAARRATTSLAKQYRHLLDTGEPMLMFRGPSRAQQVSERYRLAWQSARQRAARHFAELNRECVDHRTTLRERNTHRDEAAQLRTAGDAELRRRLDQCERARASLVAQIATLQKVNEFLNEQGAAVADQAWREARRAKAGDLA